MLVLTERENLDNNKTSEKDNQSIHKYHITSE